MNAGPGRLPRLTLQRLRGPVDPDYRVWRTHVRSLIRADEYLQPGRAGPSSESEPADPKGAVILWRLDSGNRRIMATSARYFATIAEAHADARRALAEVERLVRTDLRSSPQGHSWRFDRDGSPAVLSARWWVKPRRRNEAADMVLGAFRMELGSVLAPAPFDMVTQQWAPDADLRIWRPQVMSELSAPASETLSTRVGAIGRQRAAPAPAPRTVGDSIERTPPGS